MLRKIHGKDLLWRVVLLFSSVGEQCQYTFPVIFRIVSSVNSIFLGGVVSFSIWLVLYTSRGHSIKLNQNTENVNCAVISGQALMGIYECVFNVCIDLYLQWWFPPDAWCICAWLVLCSLHDGL
jgi:hypothetical protein